MSKIITTPILTTLVLVLSLFLIACEKDEKAKPATEKAEPAQVSQPASEPETLSPESTPAANSEPPSSTVPEATPELKTSPVTQKTSTNNQQMLNLARKSGCLACHNVDKKLVGPAWKDVAARYQNKADARALLIEKVSRGGRGSWTNVVGNVAMPAYFPRVSKKNIESLVDFILSL